MANTRKAAAPKPPKYDVDALLADAPEGEEVVLTWRGEQWTFRPLQDAPLGMLIDQDGDHAQQTHRFLNTMLVAGELPADTTMREAQALLNTYTEAATAGALDTGN